MFMPRGGVGKGVFLDTWVSLETLGHTLTCGGLRLFPMDSGRIDCLEVEAKE